MGILNAWSILVGVTVLACSGAGDDKSPCVELCESLSRELWPRAECSEDFETIGGVKVDDGELYSCTEWMGV